MIVEKFERGNKMKNTKNFFSFIEKFSVQWKLIGVAIGGMESVRGEVREKAQFYFSTTIIPQKTLI